MSSHAADGARRTSKVAIPRQERRNDPPRRGTTARQNRVSRACLTCRARKIKCDGAQPTCQHCNDNATTCIYVSNRKDRLKTATEQNKDMIQLLRELSAVVGDADKGRIEEMLGNVAEDVVDAASALLKSSTKAPAAQEEQREVNTSAEVGSDKDLDTMNEDLLHSEQSQATGYLGRTSPVQWLRRVHQEADTAGEDGGTREGPHGPPGEGAKATAMRAEALKQRQKKSSVPLLRTSSCNFYLDDETMDMGFAVDPFVLPPLETAEKLLQCYMETIQNSYPILAKETFVNQFYDYYSSVSRGVLYQLPQKWQAILNLVFAIGATYSHLIGAAWRADERDHFLYHSRAWALSLKDPWWFSHPDVPQTQITGLLALYYLVIGHVNRSWIVIGMAMRFGVGLGLHVRNEDRTASAVKKEILSRIWWGLYSLERILCAMTGRPSVGSEAFCSVAFPLPISSEEIDEDRIRAQFGERPQDGRMATWAAFETSSASSHRTFEPTPEAANSGSYLTCTAKLGMLTQRVLNSLYSPAIVSRSWEDVQHTILSMSEDLEAWAAQLPRGFNFYRDTSREQAIGPELNILRIYYHSAKILISRPCLCRIDRRIKNQSQSSNDFNQRMAASCVGAAKALTTLLPEDMSGSGKHIYEVFPWWAAVHYIMQSLAVLMLEIFYELPASHERDDTMPTIKKLVRWLRALRSSNGMARRGYSVAFDLLQKIDIRTKLDISDLVKENDAEDAQAYFGIKHPPDVFAPHVFTDEDFLEQSPSQTHNPYANFMTQESYRAAEQPLPDLFHEALLSNTSLGNLFLTGFDQQNPLPLGYQSGDVPMGDYGEQEEQSRAK